jgi:hypothetical protein
MLADAYPELLVPSPKRAAPGTCLVIFKRHQQLRGRASQFDQMGGVTLPQRRCAVIGGVDRGQRVLIKIENVTDKQRCALGLETLQPPGLRDRRRES